MASYTAPGVQVVDVVSGSQSITEASASVGALIGVAPAGIVNKPKKIGSWSEYIENFANGLETPFSENSYLSYSVYGFFQNGGQELYVINVRKKAKAAKTVEGGITATAASEGSWANSMTLEIKKEKDYDEVENPSFSLTAKLGDNSYTIPNLMAENFVETVNNDKTLAFWMKDIDFEKSEEKEDVSGKDENVEAQSDSVPVLEEILLTFQGGTDGEELTDSDYVNAVDLLNELDDVTLIGVPGQTSAVINDYLLSFADNNKMFPMLDMPIGSTAEETKAYRKSISAFSGELAWPWGRMNDPLTNKLKTVPTVGHLMGVYSRTITSRGAFKAPAGTDAVVRGFLEMETNVTPTQLSTLNPVGVVCIMSRPNAGIVVWGARSLNSTDSTMRYVSDGLLNIVLTRSLYNGTQFAVFEPNDEFLWKRLTTACKAFLENMRANGALKGSSDEAFFVTCDSTNNTEYTIGEGQVHIDVGYAPVKPGEFVIIHLAHSIVSE